MKRILKRILSVSLHFGPRKFKNMGENLANNTMDSMKIRISSAGIIS